MIDLPIYCPHCGAVFPDVDLLAGRIQCVQCNKKFRVNSYKNGAGKTLCPKCGHANDVSSFTCEQCETVLWQFIEETLKDKLSENTLTQKKNPLNQVSPKTDEQILQKYRQYWTMGKRLHRHQNFIWIMSFVVMSCSALFFIPLVIDFFEITLPICTDWGIPIAIILFIFGYLKPIPLNKQIEAKKMATKYPGFDKFFIHKQGSFFSYWPYPDPDEEKLNEFERLCGRR